MLGHGCVTVVRAHFCSDTVVSIILAQYLVPLACVWTAVVDRLMPAFIKKMSTSDSRVGVGAVRVWT